MKKAEKKSSGTVARSIKMPVDLDAKVEAIAKAEDRSWSYIVVRAVREAVERATLDTTDGKR